MIRDEPLGWTEIPLNRIQYGSDYAQGSEKWHHLSTLRRTGEEIGSVMFVSLTVSMRSLPSLPTVIISVF